MPEPNPSSNRLTLRHCLATLAYRAGKAMRGAPPDFANHALVDGARTPGQIVAHMGDLFDWALSMARGKQAWHDSKPLPWEQEKQRFFASLTAFDKFLASGEAPAVGEEVLFQGPVADALTHVGQLAMLRRTSGSPIRAENYAQAEIEAGRTGEQQAAAAREF